MSAQEATDQHEGRFRGFGYPRETRPDEVSNDPTLKRMISELNADMEAKRLRTEAEMNTPENRRKAAKVIEEELAEKRRAWGARAWALPLDGFKGIHDSAEDKELKVYTRTYDLKHKFWGVKPIGMTIWDFWDIYDPEVKRYYDANQETPASPETSVAALPPMDKPQRTKSIEKTRRRQKVSDISPAHRVRKSTTPQPKVNKNTRKSLAHTIETGNSRLRDRIREVKPVASVSGRSTRIKAATTSSCPKQKLVKAESAVQDNISSPLKSPRGHPLGKRKSTGRAPKQKTPALKGKARITKSSQKQPRPSAPSTHKMRTRRAGPAEPL